MEIVTLLRTVQKLKAAVAAIIDDDRKLLNKSKQLYLWNVALDTDSDEQSYRNSGSKNDFLKYMDKDESQE